MTRLNPLSGPGNWYKGNLHCHSTASDGDLTYNELKAAYLERGYSFIGFSDHNIYYDMSNLSDENFLVLPAVELGALMPEGDPREFHVNGILGSSRMLSRAQRPPFRQGEVIKQLVWENIQTAQQMIDALDSRGFLVFFNHPDWSCNNPEDILDLERLSGMEVLNYCAQVLENMGDSSVLYDYILRTGKRLWCYATDDNHNWFPLDSPLNDSGGGFVWVKSEGLTHDGILDALEAGRFYASGGPQISSFRIEGNEVVFECSPVERMYITANVRQLSQMNGPAHQDSVMALRHKLIGTETYVRGECVDKYGRRAYTNPIFLD